MFNRGDKEGAISYINSIVGLQATVDYCLYNFGVGEFTGMLLDQPSVDLRGKRQLCKLL